MKGKGFVLGVIFFFFFTPAGGIWGEDLSLEGRWGAGYN